MVAAAVAQMPPAVLETTVTGFSPERAVVAVPVGSKAGVEIGDRFWVFRGGGIDAAGEIQVVTAEGSAGAAAGAADITPGRPVTILRSAALAACRDNLPPEVTIRGRIARVPPGRRNAWLDLGAHSGINVGDTLLVRRLTQNQVELPLARGRVEIVRDQTALVVLAPLVGNALPQPGDIAELWPSPADRRLGRLESMVLKTRPAAEPEGDLLITLVGTAEDGLERGRLVDLFRGREYIGHAAIADVGDRNCSALVFAAGRRPQAEIKEGDRACVRSPAGSPAMPLSAAIFEILSTPDGQFARIAAGETDGVQTGEKFIVRRRDDADATLRKDIAELTVQSVHVDHCTAGIHPLDPQAPPVRVWDFAERREPLLPDWRAIGIVQERVVPASHAVTATLEPLSTAVVGRIVRCVPEEPADPHAPAPRAAAAIVIHRSGDEAVLFVPPGWGQVEDLANARVELFDPTPATRPAGE